jgi:hypothetical protein
LCANFYPKEAHTDLPDRQSQFFNLVSNPFPSQAPEKLMKPFNFLIIAGSRNKGNRAGIQILRILI